MIAHLTGLVFEKQPPYLVIDVHGVGYECTATDYTFAQLPEVGQPTSLYIHFVVREDAQQLFAFSDRSERFLFRHLLKVSGIGPKLAVTILSSASVHTLTQAILDQNVAQLTQVPGIGKKTAERLIMEMRDRLAKAWPSFELSTKDPALISKTAFLNDNIAHREALEGLISLGYKPPIAAQLIKQAQEKAGTEILTAEQLLRQALQGIHAS